ncbi:hypothetical protein Apa02nite_034770 [Actinoplanes palleronii]|uniref:DUF4352 domain-containing protein n=2 Tax=Actinoplanes palleronii TaxID=113570 RepID=A0ABQ4B9I3_9ACTN|nr:hypothetical protein Apa02nite_034770 [Actinoplanes palleronii]
MPPLPSGWTVPAAGPVTIHDVRGAAMTISIPRVQDPELSSFPELDPAPGNRLLSITVQVLNSGDVTFTPDVDDNAWLTDTRGVRYGSDPVMSAALQAFPVTALEPDWSLQRVLVFEVGADTHLDILHIRHEADTATWPLDTTR